MVRMPQSKTPAPVKAMPRVASPSQERLGSMDQNGLSFKISPDLNVESGEGAGITLQGRELEAMVFEEGQTDENVLPLFMPSVNYPQRARELGIQGTLKAIITIDRDGTVVKVDIVKSPHQSISEEAKKTIMTWKFKPAKIKGIPVKVRRVQDIEFKLDGE
jgi:protein TonB